MQFCYPFLMCVFWLHVKYVGDTIHEYCIFPKIVVKRHMGNLLVELKLFFFLQPLVYVFIDWLNFIRLFLRDSKALCITNFEDAPNNRVVTLWVAPFWHTFGVSFNSLTEKIPWWCNMPCRSLEYVYNAYIMSKNL